MWRISSEGRIETLVVFRATAASSFVPIGELTFEGGGATRIGRFAYARSYLGSDDPRPIDPINLPLGRSSKSAGREEVPLAFHDAGPDGWGKGVLDQAFPVMRLSMPEYLALGGARRTGDLAFGPNPKGPETWIPETAPFLRLPDDDDDLEALVAAAAAVDEGIGDRSHLERLFRHSADVGGARPKARLHLEGIDWIAKFPAWGDVFDDPKAEAACLDVAEAAGLPVSERRVLRVGGRSVLLVRRFDRGTGNAPFGYLSAGTLLKEPSSTYRTNKTYVDIAVAARRIGVASPERCVFRRLLVNSYLHNTDDHLRNHAVIHTEAGWRLAPVFDLVPHPKIGRHVCAPAPGLGPAWDPDLAFSAHGRFGIPISDALGIREQVVDAVERFPEFLRARQVSRPDREFLISALPSSLRSIRTP